MDKDHFRGVLMGTFIGDVVGAPFEGAHHDRINETIRHARGELEALGQPVAEMDDELLLFHVVDALFSEGNLRYTDDTQMMIGLAEALLESEDEVDLGEIAARFAANFEHDRGYGGTTWHLLDHIQRGMHWRDALEELGFEGGSFANGAAMRVAPVALAFPNDSDAVARAAELQAEASGHTHPDAKFGARAQALAVHRALVCAASGTPFRGREFVKELTEIAPKSYQRALQWIPENRDAEPSEAAGLIGTGIRASEAVPAALWCFLARQGDAVSSLMAAVRMGGDTDTIAAMTGAISGAYHGIQGFTPRWLDSLENGTAGRDYVLLLADRLFERAD